MKAIGLLWRDHRALAVAFAAATVVLAFFLVRSLVFWVYWSDPAHREVRLEGWMTPGYVARAWGVDRDAVMELLGPPPSDGSRPTLAEIAAARGQSFAEFEAQVMAMIRTAKTRE